MLVVVASQDKCLLKYTSCFSYAAGWIISFDIPTLLPVLWGWVVNFSFQINACLFLSLFKRISSVPACYFTLFWLIITRSFDLVVVCTGHILGIYYDKICYVINNRVYLQDPLRNYTVFMCIIIFSWQREGVGCLCLIQISIFEKIILVVLCIVICVHIVGCIIHPCLFGNRFFACWKQQMMRRSKTRQMVFERHRWTRQTPTIRWYKRVERKES